MRLQRKVCAPWRNPVWIFLLTMDSVTGSSKTGSSNQISSQLENYRAAVMKVIDDTKYSLPNQMIPATLSAMIQMSDRDSCISQILGRVHPIAARYHFVCDFRADCSTGKRGK